MEETKICEKCGKKLNLKNSFYYTNNTQKYPDHHLNICKDCITINIDKTYLQILQECDVPYIFEEWDKLVRRYKEPRIVFNRYMSKMKLKGFKDYRWKDTSFLNEPYEGGNLNAERAILL